LDSAGILLSNVI